MAIKLLLYGSYFSVLVPILLLLAKKQNLKVPFIQVLFVLMIAGTISDLLGYILIKTGRSNTIVNNIFFIVQFFLLSYFYYLLLDNKKLVYAALVLFTGSFIVNTVYIQPFTEYQSWSRIAGGILLISYAIICFRQTLTTPLKDEGLDEMLMWINIAVMFYFGFSMYLFASTNYIFKNESADVAILAWGFYNFVNIVKNVLFATGLYYAGRKAG